VRGEAVTLTGTGIYRYNPLMLGAGFPAQDVVQLVVLPVLALSVLAFARGRTAAIVPLLATLGFAAYLYASMALGAALDWLFPAYVVLFSASFLALWLAARLALPVLDPAHLPRRGLAAFLALAGVATFAIWVPPLVADLAAGRTPPRLDSQTTKVTHALDLGLIVPLCLIAARLVLKRDPLGHAIALPLLGCILFLLPVIVLATILQIRAGVIFMPAEITGPIGGFLVLGLGGAWFLRAAWRGMRA
jgi:hypothetical protein